MPEPERWDTFISYSRAHLDWVHLLASNLESLGLRVFFDEWEVEPGDLVSRRIEAGIAGSSAGIVVCSDDTFTRPFVNEEYTALLNNAVLEQRRLIGVLFRLASVDTLPPGLRSRQWIDFRGRDGDAYLSAVQRLADALRGKRPERPSAGAPLVVPSARAIHPGVTGPPAPERHGAFWEARTILTDALMDEHPVVELLGDHLGGDRPGDPRESTRHRAERIAAAIDALGEGPDAAVCLVDACYQAVSAVKTDLAGAKRVLRGLLSEWLPHRYGRGLAVEPVTRGKGCEDLRVCTPNHPIAALSVAHRNKRPARFVAHGTKMLPEGALPIAVLCDGEIRVATEVANGIADAMASQIPSPPGTAPSERRRQAARRLAFLRKPGLKADPKHVAIPTEDLKARSRAELEAVLVVLKEIYPALQVVELGDTILAEEEEIIDPLLTIFEDEPA